MSRLVWTKIYIQYNVWEAFSQELSMELRILFSPTFLRGVDLAEGRLNFIDLFLKNSYSEVYYCNKYLFFAS